MVKEDAERCGILAADRRTSPELGRRRAIEMADSVRTVGVEGPVMHGLKTHLVGLAIAVALVWACGGALGPHAGAPAGVPPPLEDGGARTPAGSPAADPLSLLPAGPRDVPAKPAAFALRLDAWEAAIKARGVALAPVECAAFAGRVPDRAGPSDLATAFAEKDAARADARLLALEPTLDPGEPGAVRGLRADLAPRECGDAIVDPYLAAHRGMTSRASHVLVGLSLAAKLSRTGTGKPSMGALRDKEKVKAFIGGPLRTWMVEQSTAIETLATGAAGLTGYGRGIAALEAGIADLRLVEIIRTAPVPPGWDPELRAAYQASLDEALEPRKKRGRDAALVGLGDLAQAGVLLDVRTLTAHALLTSLYGGRRISALTALMVPRPPDPTPATPLQSALMSVAPFWSDVLELPVTNEADVPVALLRGTSQAMRAYFATTRSPALQPDMRAAYARARFRMGQLYWRRVDFVEAAYAARQGGAPEDRLLLALCLALAQGPDGAAEMMRAPSAFALDLRHTEALDALVAEGGPMAGWAAFDAAHLRSLSPPDGPAAAPYFRELAARFRKAESLLTDPARKTLATRRAEEVDAILSAMEQPRRPDAAP